MLVWADIRGRGQRDLSQTWKSALVVGAAQALALIPGTSRSGITITAAFAMGFDRESAARFSFLLAIPVIILSGGLKGLELINSESVDWSIIVIGTLLSAVTAYLCIKFFKVIQQIGMMPFVIYRMLLGALLIYLVWQ